MKIRPLPTALLTSAVVGVAMIPLVRKLRRRRNSALGHDAYDHDSRSARVTARDGGKRDASRTTAVTH